MNREKRADWRFANLQAFIGNVSPNKPRHKRFRAEDFMPTPRQEQTPEQHQSILQTIAGKFKR